MITIAHISDLHFGDACPVALERARAALTALAPDCIVATGDITQAGRRSEFAAAAAWFATLPAPLVACPGNHDAPVYSVVTRMVRPYQRFQDLGLGTQWAAHDGGAAVVAWNSARAVQARLDWSQGVHREREVGEALAQLRALAPQGWGVLACHHPPGPPDGAPIRVATRFSDRTRTALSSTEKTLMLCGHVHHYSVEIVGGARIVTAPTLSSSRARRHGCGFVVIRLGDEAEIEAVTL
jgi:3',5'-cyclic AMP phosphodiesterase CpdA